ncbi:accessory gene regulator B family protein [Cohnella algarum]|nr:accessory gene regulator B family protein [Cohnella algarum]MBN2983996.1 accessory gene regulator B family protein [Cohnella algarum]
MKRNGADPSVSERTLRFALMLWISMIFIIMLTAAGGIFLGVFSEAIAALAVLGLLRYFSGAGILSKWMHASFLPQRSP